jgi:hypothetical protein
MNWKQGFLRIWIVASVCWVSFVGWLFYNATVVSQRLAAVQAACVEDRRADPSLGNVFDCFEMGMRIDDLTTFGSILAKHLALAVGPMVGAVVIWFVVSWILAGFHSQRA